MKLFDQEQDIPTQQIDLSIWGINNHKLFLRREDLLHPQVSGNKFRKLKYNLLKAKEQGKNILLTFGGAYSNHISAVAAAAKQEGFKSIGIIRGEELSSKISENPTLSYAQYCGMQLIFISRSEYRTKEDAEFLNNLQKEYGDFYLLPEGGTNALAVKGCKEILRKEDSEYAYICAAVGTGGTLSGLVKASYPKQQVLGFSALKGSFQTEEVRKHTSKTNFKIIDSYCFGGYGKIDSELVRFINECKRHTGIPLDPIYTGKMMFGIVDLLKNGYFKENSRIFAVHSGGLQGISGMNQKLRKRNLPLIE